MLLLLLSWFCFFSFAAAIKNYFSYGAHGLVDWKVVLLEKIVVWVVFVASNISLPCLTMMTTFVVNNWMDVRSAFVSIMVVDCCFVCCGCWKVWWSHGRNEEMMCVVCNYWWWVKFHVALSQRWAKQRTRSECVNPSTFDHGQKLFGRRDFHGRIKSFFCSWSTNAERSWEEESTAIFCWGLCGCLSTQQVIPRSIKSSFHLSVQV